MKYMKLTAVGVIVGGFALSALAGSAEAAAIPAARLAPLSELANGTSLALPVDDRHYHGSRNYRPRYSGPRAPGGQRYSSRRYSGPRTYGRPRSAERYRYSHRHTHRSTRHRHAYDRRYHGPRYKKHRHGYDYYYGGWWYAFPWFFYSIPYGGYYQGNYIDAHIEWCLGRYRSYNPSTDMYLGYDGHYHYCNSPYR